MWWRFRSVAWGTCLAVVVAIAAGCGDDDDDGNGGGSGGTGDGLAVQTRPDALKVDIQGVEVPEGGGAPTITFKVTDGTTAVTTLVQEIRNGVAQPAAFPWTSVPRVVLSKLDPTSGDYTSYYTRPQTGRQWQREDDPAVNEPVQPSADQATFDQAPTDATLDQRLTHQGDGVYRYTLAALPAGAQVDRAATHTAGLWLTRHTAAGEAATSSSTDTVSFVPAGGTAAKDEVVTLAACNRCHAPAVAAHDERLGVNVCQTCHSPQSTDPDTGNTVDFKVMVHRIHRGGELPSAQGTTGTPYTIVGFRAPGSTDPKAGVHVYDGAFINDVRNCTLCHQGEDADRWKTNANLAACTSCHDNVRFDGSAGATACALGDDLTAPCNHPPVGQTACNTCHSATAASIGVQTVHVPLSEQAKAFRYDIMNVTVGADRIPVVRFAVRKPDSSAYVLASDPAYTAPGASLNAMFGWPTTDYTNEGSGATSPGQPLRVPIVGGTPTPAVTNVTPVDGQPGVYDLRATAAIPAGVTSASVHLEGHPILNGEEMPVENAIRNFGVGGGAAADRRQVVDVQKCDACHGYLSAHGNNRNNVVQVCAVCHNRRATDAGRRGTGSPGAAEPAESIDFKRMIHEIHAAGIRGEEITIYGFGNTAHTFPGELPSTTPNCAICHVANTWNLPLNDAISGPTLFGADTEVPATIAVCTACHDQTTFAAGTGLPLCNTLAELNSAPCAHSGSPATTDATCSACHGAGGAFDVSSVHPIQQ